MRYQRKDSPAVSTSSMADIAFLLLTFFLVTTQIQNDRGLTLILPPSIHEILLDVNKRNLFTIQVNSKDRYLIDGKIREDIDGLREDIKAFVLNYGKLPSSSDDPGSAVVSLKTDRGTSHKTFIEVLDEIQAAYYDIYSERAGITSKEFRALDQSIPRDKALYDKGRVGIPMNISIAEPTQVSN